MKAIRTTMMAGLTALGAGSASAEVELSFAHWLSAAHPLQVGGIEPWAKSIEEASQGRIRITIYPAQQLGAAADHYDLARDGIADIAYINTGYQPGRFPVVGASDIPFTVSDARAGSRALHEWYLDYAAAEMPDVYLCALFMHDPGTLHAKRGPLAAPADVTGMNVRPASATFGRFMNALGAASVQGAASEMRDMLGKGTADATASPWGTLFTFGAQDLVTHHLDMPFYVATLAFVMNRDRIDALAPEDRAVMDGHCTPEWSERIATPWADSDASGRQKIIDLGGHTLYVPTPGQVQEWKDAVQPLVEEWRAGVAKAGHDPDAVHSGLTGRLKAAGALVE